MTAENISLYTVCFIMQYVTEQNLHDVVHVLTQPVGFVYSTSTKYCSLWIDTKPVVCDNDDVVCRCI